MSRTKYDYDNCIGKTYNHLTVLREAPPRRRRSLVCECTCGSIKEYEGHSVLGGKTKSCGCTRLNKLRTRNKKDNPSKYRNPNEKYPYDECIGTTVNGLKFIKEIERSKYGRRQFTLLCKCGRKFNCDGVQVFNGSVKSCGCYRSESSRLRSTSHGLTGSPEHRIWASMIQRCVNKKNKSYKDYGGRGIKVCAEWSSFETFLNDMGVRPTENHTLERINVDGDYTPENCKWETRTIQNRNQRIRKDNSTGVRGVSKSGNKYLVRITVNRKRITIGSFSSLSEARLAREEAELKYW